MLARGSGSFLRRHSLLALCLANMKDEEIDTSDIPELDNKFFKTATVELPTKQPITIRIDTDVIDSNHKGKIIR